ncbi:MAG: helix-turn-helix domain-containing protein [Dehalococcoidia bacterium]|nr:helix-turn-helix domain-containing protein [Dehalococcoidia bacterium]
MASTSQDRRGALRPNEAAQWLSCSRDTIDRLCATGELKSFKIGMARFVAVSELERFIAERQAAAS